MLSGLLIGTSYIPFPPWALFFGAVPLFVSWARARTAKQALFDGWLTQTILTFIGFHWVAHTAYEFGHLPRPVSWLILILFCTTAHLYYAAAGWASWRLTHLKRWATPAPVGVRVALAATLLLLFELLFPVLFPWHLGYAWLWAGWPGAQTADVIGFEGLNVASIAVNACLAYAWLARERIGRALAAAGVAAAIVFGLNAWGLERKAAWDATDAELNVLAVQGNIGNFEKMYANQGMGYQTTIIDRYMRLTREGYARFPEAQIALWPETAFPDNLDRAYMAMPHPLTLSAFARETGRPVATGAYSQDMVKRAYYNGFFVIGADGEPVGDGYRKSILLAFGEYFPGSQYIPWIFDLIPTISSFGRGLGPTTIEVAGAKVGPQICYEGLYPDFSAGLARAGAEIVLNVTNDSWFGDDFEPRQHLYMTLARALEIRRPLLRATNTGITTAILANGDVLEKSPQNQEWFGLYKMRYKRAPPATIYQKIEGIWPWALAFCAALLIGCAHVAAQRTARRARAAN